MNIYDKTQPSLQIQSESSSFLECFPPKVKIFTFNKDLTQVINHPNLILSSKWLKNIEPEGLQLKICQLANTGTFTELLIKVCHP